MFVGLMSDLRKAVAQTFFRAQIGMPPQARQRPRQRLVLSGPSDAPDTAAGGPALQQRHERTTPLDAVGVAHQARTRPGMGSAGAVATAPAGVGTVTGPDPRQLATNRGEERRAKIPVMAEKEPGRNDPCPCGSGKKYKKCHGAVRHA